MFVIMGGTGHIGSAAAQHLLERGEDVTVVTRDAAGADPWRERGAEVAEADAGDAEAVRAVFRTGDRALLLNPPADVSRDVDAEERRTIAAILEALDGSGLTKVVAVSTYGAQPAEHLADLGTLWDLEQGLAAQPIPAAINRGGYYLSNLDGLVDVVRETGELPSFLPADLPLPLVAPADLGVFAAERLLSDVTDVGIVHVEGPRRRTMDDVARAFATALGRDVRVAVTPRAEWLSAWKAIGFSDEAARTFAAMTALTVDQGSVDPPDPRRGSTTIEAYVQGLVDRA